MPEPALFGWTTSTVEAMRHLSGTVDTVAGVYTTVVTARTYPSSASIAWASQVTHLSLA